MRHLSLEGKITIFKSLTISKMVYLALLTLIPSSFLEELKQIQKTFLWGNKRAKIKHDTLCNNFNEGGLKNVDIKHKFSALRCSWIQRLYNENFHEWKLIPLRYIHKAFGKNFKFHSNLHIPSDLICTFPTFYQDIITSWCNYYTSPPTLPSTISSQYLWFNTFIKIENRVVYYKEFSDNQINYVCDFFDRNGNLKSWVNFVHEYKIEKKMYFKWFQLIHAIPKSWKKDIQIDQGNCRNLLYLNHRLIKSNQTYSIEKLKANELIFSFHIVKNSVSTSKRYFESFSKPIFYVEKRLYISSYCKN